MDARTKAQRMLAFQTGPDQQGHLYFTGESIKWYARSFGLLRQLLNYPGERQWFLQPIQQEIGKRGGYPAGFKAPGSAAVQSTSQIQHLRWRIRGKRIEVL